MSEPALAEQQTQSDGEFLFELSGIDLSARAAGREEIDRIIPHRHELALLDEVIWISEDRSLAVGAKNVGADEFWVRGHFPERPLFPGVLMVEAAAQLACYQFNIRQERMQLAAFLRIEDCAFRKSVEPGQRLILLCKEIKYSRRRFVTAAQGIVFDAAGNRSLAFEAKLSGMSLGDSVGV